MSLPTIGRGLIVALMGLLLLLVSLSLTISPQAAFAQSSVAEQASVTISPTQGTTGTQVTATGSNWVAGDTIHVLWDGTSGTDIKQGTVDGDGNFRITFTVPSDAGSGQHTVAFWDEQQRTFQTAVFTVT